MCLTVNMDECKQFYNTMPDKIKCYKIVKEINKQFHPLYFRSMVYTFGEHSAVGVEQNKPAHLNRDNRGLEKCLVRFGFHVYTSLDEAKLEIAMLRSIEDSIVLLLVECEKQHFLGYSDNRAVFSKMLVKKKISG